MFAINPFITTTGQCRTHPCNSEISENTPRNPSCHTSVLNLRRARVGVHLRELKLGLGTGTLGEGGVADDVAERLSTFS